MTWKIKNVIAQKNALVVAKTAKNALVMNLVIVMKIANVVVMKNNESLIDLFF